MKRYNVGMIGYGYWGRILLRYFRKHSGFNVKSIATRHPDIISGEIPAGIKACLPDEIIRDEEIDAVIIATPIGTHFEPAKNALDSGKHLFVEKPLMLDPGEAQELAGIAGRNGLRVFTDYIFTFSPAILKMISLIEEGAVGKVTGASFHVRQLGHFSKNNVYVDLGCHILSVLDLITPINGLEFTRSDILSHDGFVETGVIGFRPVSGVSNPDKSKSETSSPYKPDGITGIICLSFNHPIKERNMTVYGDRGTIVYDMMQKKPLQILHYGFDREKTRDPLEKKITYFDFDEFNTVKEVVDGFYRVLTGKSPSNLDMSMRVTEALQRFR